MPIDNFSALRPFLQFEDEFDFYYLQIIRRRKDNPELDRENKIVKNYFIGNLEYLDRKEKEIKDLCYHFNARAYLRLNRRNYKDLSLQMMQLLAKYISSYDHRAVRKIFTRVAGRYNSEDDRIWLIDVDDDQREIGELMMIVNECQPSRPNGHVLRSIRSKSGEHILTQPFNKKQFQDILKERDKKPVEIQTDNPTNLYIP